MKKLIVRRNLGPLRKWFDELTTSGDIVTTFHWTLHTWQAFKRQFETSSTLFVTMREKRIVAAFWTGPYLDGAEIGAWTTKDLRMTPSIFRAYLQAIAHLASRLPVVIACTIRVEVEKLLLHMGFEQVGAIPEAWDGMTVKVFSLNKDKFNAKVEQRLT